MKTFVYSVFVLPLLLVTPLMGSATVVTPVAGVSVLGQVDSQRLQWATMVQEMQMLKQEVEKVKFQMNQLESRNRELYQALENQQKFLRDMQAGIVTLNELQTQIAASKREILAENQRSQKVLVDQVNKQIETLGQRTDQALAQMAKTINQAPRSTTTNVRQPGPYPETGFTHTVAAGETLSSIAARYKARVNHIMDANGITDARSLQVGRSLFIPVENPNQ